MAWTDAGVKEQLFLAEDTLTIPSVAGGVVTRSLQRAGLVRRLRMIAEGEVVATDYVGAPDQSAYGPLAGLIRRVRVAANGQIPLFDLSGLGATVYNEIINRDGSVQNALVATSAPAASPLTMVYSYPAIGADGTFNTRYAFELPFSMNVQVQNIANELGLWVLQNQTIDVTVETTFNTPADGVAPNTLYTGGNVTLTPTVAATRLLIERELYSVPRNPANFPSLVWAHQVLEAEMPFTGSVVRYNIPKAGLLLRVIAVNLDDSGDAIVNTDVAQVEFVYGANETPIRRSGQFITQEYVQDYGRLPVEGSFVLDFYKWGEYGFGLVKNTEQLSNLRLETTFSAATAGTQKLIIDRLVPVLTSAGG